MESASSEAAGFHPSGTYGMGPAVPFIPFKITATGWSGGLWAKCFHDFQFRRRDFLKFYHKRSSVESTFSMIKRKFGDSLRSK